MKEPKVPEPDLDEGLPDLDPTEEPSPPECDAKIDQCEVRVHDMEAKPHEAEVGFMEEIQEAYQPQEIRMRLHEDGMPVPADESPNLAIAPAFTYENMVCVEDKRPGHNRERCIHYKRQVFLNDDQPDPDLPGHKLIFRNCAIRKSVGGASLSLRDEAVLACDWREPRDIETEQKYLDGPDTAKLNSTPHKVKLPLFNNGDKTP